MGNGVVWDNQIKKFKKYFYSSKIFKQKYRELKDREVKIKREIEELFLKPIIVFRDDTDRFGKKEMNKIRPIKQ